MRRALWIAALGLAALAASPVQSAELGTAYCFGVGCPCGNDDPTGGCMNSSGHGARLVAVGSTSVAAADLAYQGTNMATNALSLLVVSPNQRRNPFGDGFLCVGPGMYRMRKHLNSGQDGALVFTNVMQWYAAYGLVMQPGETWNAQVWFRDTAHGGVCDGRSNTTNGYTVTLTP